MHLRTLSAVLVMLAVVATACTPGGEEIVATTTTVGGSTITMPPEEKPDPGFYLNLMWHQHQPFYPKDEAGVYTRPWVRVHATKDYYDMAALAAEYPNVAVTFNLTPVLLLQLEDLANGARDSYWVHTETPAESLTADEVAFIEARFFDVNPRIIARIPRFQELAEIRGSRPFTADELRDLQALFNLAWTDPSFLAEEPLAALVAKGRGFTEADKQVVLDEHLRIIRGVIPLHARLWSEGRIEVTTTPLAHPILPLIADSSLGAVGDPAALMPDTRFQEIPDADEHVIRGLDTAERLLGRRPVGMWPGEGSVAQLVMSLFSKNGVGWVASGEEVLAKTLDIGSFTRTSADLVEQADQLYRPYAAQLRRNDPVAMFFRDGLLSDLIGFEYSGTEAQAAADDFMRRLEAIHDALDEQGLLGGDQPPVVSVILDGENAWEHYANDGIDFLRALYERLDTSDFVRTITPSEYLERFADPAPVGDVWPGAWFQPNYATWIGEEEEATAWEYLFETRSDLEKSAGAVSEEAYAAAFEKMLFAEGSDWFWWYGSDQDSGNDAYFDTAFRELLGQVYDALGQDRPVFVGVPIIPQQPVVADVAPSVDLLTIAVDGDTASQWSEAGTYRDVAGADVAWAFDKERFYLLVGSTEPFQVWVGAPEGERRPVTFSGEVLGFGATHVVAWDGEVASLCDPAAEEFHPESCIDLASAVGDGVELAIPLELLGPLEPGDSLLAKLVDGPLLAPVAGPMAFQVPDISDVTVLLDVEDPIGDDHGPGTYTYPTDGVFAAGSYDLTRFQFGTDGEDFVFNFEVVAPIQNPWGSPRGLSVQTFDVYIDTDPGAGTGARLLIPGRNAALPEGTGWEYGITVEGWDPAIYLVGPDGAVEETKPSFDVVVFGDKGKVTVKIPQRLLPGDPSTWSFGVAVMSQEGFPSSGVRRIRDVEAAAAQYRVGGSPGGINATRILDVVLADEGRQEELLASFEVVASGDVDGLGPEDFGILGLVGG
jgi:alpha-amylase/alpha-mannosidase (GH57 family)